MSGSGPIYEYQRELTAKLDAALRERDEARAEVERLTQSLAMAEQVSGVLCDDCGWAMKFPDEPCRCEIVKQLEEARAEVERLQDERARIEKAHVVALTLNRTEAYQRGAEAMREEAATRVDGEGINVGSYFGGIIRALPIPEDEP
jgi:hypothetical protein